MMSAFDLNDAVARFRRFNRFYTKQIGLLNQGLLKTRFPLIQARVLYELAQQDRTTASILVDKLNIDPGYLSRILSRFAKEGLIRKHRSRSDSRQRILKLTTLGKNVLWKAYPQNEIRDRNVVIVDDIFDQGYTVEEIEAWPERLEKVTLEDIQRVARKYFDTAQSVTGVLRPVEKKKADVKKAEHEDRKHDGERWPEIIDQIQLQHGLAG